MPVARPLESFFADAGGMYLLRELRGDLSTASRGGQGRERQSGIRAPLATICLTTRHNRRHWTKDSATQGRRPANGVNMSLRTFLLLSAALLIMGCSRPDSPETQVRNTVKAIEAAVEARDVGEVMTFISLDFRDGYGQGPDELRRRLYGYFIANQSIHLLARIDQLDFPTAGEARLKVTVGMAGRDAGSAASWDLAADVRHYDITMRTEGGDWKVTFVEVEPTG